MGGTKIKDYYHACFQKVLKLPESRTRISQAAAAACDIWGVLKYHEPVFIPNAPKKACCFLFILQGKQISHLK